MTLENFLRAEKNLPNNRLILRPGQKQVLLLIRRALTPSCAPHLLGFYDNATASQPLNKVAEIKCPPAPALSGQTRGDGAPGGHPTLWSQAAGPPSA